MLTELRVENLGLLRDVHLELGPGLNVITGETGAGKTLCVEALSYLCGARATRGSIGPWGSSTSIEARFVAVHGCGEDDVLGDAVEDSRGGGEIVVRRVLDESGRSRQYLNGRMATVAEVEAAVGGLVQIYGQFSAQSLAEPRRQLRLLDTFCGPELAEVLDRYAGKYRDVKAAERRLTELENAGGVASEIDILEYQIEEIAAAQLELGEDEVAAAEVRRLEVAEALRGGAAEACDALDAAEDASWRATTAGPEPGCDPAFDSLRDRCRPLAEEIRDLRREFRAYLEGIEADEARLAEVRDRLELIGSLKRKYGPTIEDILALEAGAKKRLEEVERAEALRSEASREREEAIDSLLRLAERISELRRAGAKDLQRAVGLLLGELGMEGALFGAVLESESPAWPGTCGPAGADSVTFTFTASKGVGPRPLQKVASGGELARLMLAIEVAIGGAGGKATLVFDEVDQGIGGAAAIAVGELLASVSSARQVLCVTHLAQVASYADVHLAVEKDSGGAVVKSLRENERVHEISRMLGGVAGSKAANRHARDILNRAAGRKAS